MSTLSILGAVQEFCGLRGLPVPTALVGATEKSAAQFLAIVKGVARECGKYTWEESKVQGTFTTIAAANQGAISTLFAPAGGFDALVKDSMWNTSKKIPISGPLTDQAWAAQTALSLAGPPYRSWIAGGNLHLSPTPTAGDTIQGIYITSFGFRTGSTPTATPSADTNTFVYPDDVIMIGIEWLWKKQKGEAYIDEQNVFLDAVARGMGKKGLPTLSLEGFSHAPGPRIYVPIGNWPV